MTLGTARKVSAVGGVTAVVAGGVAVTTTWASRTTPERLWRRRSSSPTSAPGPLAVAAAVAAWDFLYYWDHRFMHTSRYMWAIHVVHHSSEHYNLSTALRQPVAEAFGTFVPFGSLCLFGHPAGLGGDGAGREPALPVLDPHRDGGALGPAETVLNTPSHHRVHHGSNRQYLDRNHGSILIVWDRLFGTFEPEGERVVYGLTKNINTFNPGASPPTSTPRCCATWPPRPAGASGCPTSCAGRDGPPSTAPSGWRRTPGALRPSAPGSARVLAAVP